MANTAFHQNQHFTYGDYLKWPEDERWELIDGVAYNMTPAPSRLHQEVSGEIFAQLHSRLKGKPCSVYAAPFDVRLPDGDESDSQISSIVQPDISVVCNQERLDKSGCRGAPDFILEIISPSTALKDQVTKTELYERHKVREYWIVHPFDQLLMIRVLGDNGRYATLKVTKLEGSVQVTAVAGLEIDLDLVGELCAAEAAKDQEQESPANERRI